MRPSSTVTGGHLMLFAASFGFLGVGMTPFIGASSYTTLPVTLRVIFLLAIASFSLEASHRPRAVALGVILFPLAMWPFSMFGMLAAGSPSWGYLALGLATIPATALTVSLWGPRTTHDAARDAVPVAAPG